MTKISSDLVLKNISKSVQVNAADLTRRFEWRMNWEKSQLEQHLQKLPENDKQGGKQQPDPVPTDTRVADGRGSDYPSINEQSSSEVREPNPEVIVTKHRGGESRQGGQRVDSGTALNRAVTVGSPQLRTPASKHSGSGAVESGSRFVPPRQKADGDRAVHVYLNGEEVEVSLRHAAFTKSEGAGILAGLRRPLLALGVDLARLTVNGDLVWQKRPADKSSGHLSQPDSDHLIDRSY